MKGMVHQHGLALWSSRNAWLPGLSMGVFILAIVFSALCVVFQAQRGRYLFAELEALRQAQHQLDTQWSRLMLERSTLLSYAHVERVARRDLGMGLPLPREIVVVPQ